MTSEEELTFDELQEKILQQVEASNYQPVKPKVIAKKLGFSGDERSQVRRAVKKLAKKGLLRYGQNHLVFPLSLDDDRYVVGTFRRTASGNGFVRPNTATPGSKRGDDFFVPRRDSRDAATGDTVRIQKKPGRGSKGPRGTIVEVLERESHQFVGTYHEGIDGALVQVDGKVFAQPVPVGDPGAKNAASQDKVVIEMIRFPSHYHEGEAVIVEVLGRKGEPGIDTLSIIREFHLPDQFGEDAIEDARAAADAFDESTMAGREDFTDQTVVTIDPQDARDFDDAISLEKLENGHWLLGVHIADVTHFVRKGTALDTEARDRATSVYLPDRVIPMLPEIISNNLASLQPDRVRYARTAILEFTGEGIPIGAEVKKTAIRSRRRFTYEEVDEYLKDPGPWRKKLAPEVFALLPRMHDLAMLLRRRRMAGGSLELLLPEVKIDLDRGGEVTGAHLVENTVSHQIIEEFMLAANQGVATLLRDQEVDFLRRIHESPDPRKLNVLTEFVRELGIPCESLVSRFEIKRVLAEVSEKPESRAVNFAVLRSMQKAVYSPKDVGHYALNADNYCHFTSPIRRYPDLTIHRIFDELAAGKRPAEDFSFLTMSGIHCSEREQRATSAERELTKVKLLNYLSSRIGETMEAVLTGVEDFGLFAQGLKLPAEGFIHISALQDDYYHYDADTHSLSGRREGNSFRLGDVIEVEIVHVDVDRRELDFRFVKRIRSHAPATGKQATGKQATGKQATGKQATGKQATGKQATGKQAAGKQEKPSGKRKERASGSRKRTKNGRQPTGRGKSEPRTEPRKKTSKHRKKN